VSSDPSSDLFLVAVDVTRRLDDAGVRYVIGGSIASSLHGEPRATLDIDLVADLRDQHLRTVIGAMSPAYYVDADAALEAIRTGGSFNAIHVASSIKVDVFIAGDDPFEQRRLETALTVAVSSVAERSLRIDTAEHTLLRKLEWYRRGGEVSERQWRDVLAIAQLQAGMLDRVELGRWASSLGVEDLLRRCLDEAGALEE